jgi:tetratricopeptide (TPR) repeat protein/mono/diheme cytochrome c family protein
MIGCGWLRRHRVVAGLVFAPAVALWPVDLPAQQVTFNRDIAPIIFEHCSTCHRAGEAAPFSLVTYAEVRSRATQIARATADRYMPPWKPEPGYGEFARARRLTMAEIGTIERWVAQGALEGNASDLPPAPAGTDGWRFGTPDLVVTMPEPYVLPAEGGDVFRTFVIPVPLTRPRFVRGLEFRPGATRAVHHANVKIDVSRASRRLDDEEAGPGFDGGSSREAHFPDGHFLGWTPGQMPRLLKNTAWQLPAGSDLVVEAHMTPTGKPEPVQLRVGLYFTDDLPSLVPTMIRLGSQSIDIPPGAADYETTDRYRLPVDVDVVAVQPHAHNLARRLEGYARLPDGTTKWLIRIPDWDFKWQDVYEYARPLTLPAGTVLEMRFTYDNSAGNARNPNRPPRRVTFGQTVSSEMGDLWLQVVARGAGDRAVLDRDYSPKMLREDIAGVEKALEAAPSDARLHADLGLCYLEAGRIGEAIAALREAARLGPRSASAHYDLGTVLLRERQHDEARRHFEMALRLKPGFAEAHNNLGIVHFTAGRYDDAIRSYRDALAAQAENVEARYNLARALTAAHRLDEAILSYREALRLRPADAEIHASIASALATLGRVDESVAHYRLALASNPDLAAALVDLAWILATSDRVERAPGEAVRLAERAARLAAGPNATILDTLAAAYFSAGQVARAIETARSALKAANDAGETELARRIGDRLQSYVQQSR